MVARTLAHSSSLAGSPYRVSTFVRSGVMPFSSNSGMAGTFGGGGANGLFGAGCGSVEGNWLGCCWDVCCPVRLHAP